VWALDVDGEEIVSKLSLSLVGDDVKVLIVTVDVSDP